MGHLVRKVPSQGGLQLRQPSDLGSADRQLSAAALQHNIASSRFPAARPLKLGAGPGAGQCPPACIQQI